MPNLKDKNKTLLVGVVFPGVEKYLDDYLYSLNNQTDKYFDILIINDGVKREALNKFQYYTNIDINSKLSPATIRQLAYNYAIQNEYSNLIFSDTDDFFSNNRIKIIKTYLQNYDFVCNDMTLVDENKNTLKDFFLSEFISYHEFNNLDSLINKNLIGLGNSAIKLNRKLNINIPENIIAVDWFIYTVLLLNNCKGVFTNETLTFYRQYNDNLVGVSNKLSEQRLQLGIQVKTLHYDEITKYCKKLKLPEEKLFSKKHFEMTELKSALQITSFKDRYINLINANFDKIYCGWWSEILTLKEIMEYEI